MLRTEIDATVDDVVRLLNVWSGIYGRCYAPGNRSYKDYGAKGVTIDPVWKGRQGQIRFVKWALKEGWKRGLDIDRKDNSKGYGPSNCRLLTHKENCQNKTNNVLITYLGETKCVSAWGDDPRCVVPSAQFQQRIKCGWEIQKALETPLRIRNATQRKEA